MDEVVNTFFTVRLQIKMYHWRTLSYSRHKATDEFIEAFDKKIDRFIETMMASRNQKPEDGFDISLGKTNDKNITDYVHSFRDWLSNNLGKILRKHETDLFNLRDEILNDVNQMLYLFKLK